MSDPFAALDRTAGGWLVPVALFILGAIGTTVAVQALHGIAEAVPAKAPPAEVRPGETQDDPLAIQKVTLISTPFAEASRS